MSTFLLVRHGANDWVGQRLAGWLPGVHLNAGGRAAAERLAERFSGTGTQAVYSSPLDRAVETAAPIASRLGLPVETCDEFGEFRMGLWEGKEIASLEADPVWRAFNTFRSGTRAPGGESMLEVQVRMLAGIERLRARHPEGTVVVVSHADPIKALLTHYAGIPIDLCSRLEIGTASVSTLRVEDWGARILGVNG